MQLFSLTTTKMMAYLDPVAGGTILQIILGTLIAISLFLRVFWSKIKSFFSRLMGKADTEQEISVEDTPTD